MKKSEWIFIGIAILALLLKYYNIPGSAFLIVISLSFLALLYFYLGFALFNNIPLRKILRKESYQGISTWRMLGAIGAGTALSQTVVGILFNILHWPGATVLLVVGMIGLGLILVTGIFKYAQSKAIFYRSLFERIALFGAVGVLLFLL